MAIDSFLIRRSGHAGPARPRSRWQSAARLAACAGALTVLVAACGDANPNYRNDYTDTSPGPVPAPTVSMTAQPDEPVYLPAPTVTRSIAVPSVTRSATARTTAPAATGSPAR